jgi:hypothetical protein
MKYLLLLLLLATNVFAQTKTVHIIYGKAPNPVSRAFVAAAFDRANDYYRLYGIKLKMGKFVTITHPTRLKMDLSLLSRIQLLDYYNDRAVSKLKGSKYNNDLILTITPPLEQGGFKYIGGFSSRVCGDREFENSANVNITEMNTNGVDRFEVSSVAIVHELGHLLGARHDNSNENLMHEAPLPYVIQGKVLGFNPDGYNQILACQKSIGWK